MRFQQISHNGPLEFCVIRSQLEWLYYIQNQERYNKLLNLKLVYKIFH